MQRNLQFRVRSGEEDLKDAGLVLDFDEIARKGSMTPEEVFVAKWYGVYNMRQPGTHMARVVVPGGVLTSSQSRALARVSEEYGQGKLSVTTRQAIQFHWLKAARLPDFLRDLQKAGLSTFHGCGDVNRNVTACPRASCCPHARFDVMPHVLETHRGFVADRALDNLPRKHKISYSGCSAACGQPYMNDVGLVAVRRERAGGGPEDGFRVLVGGGHGWKAFVAQELYAFVPRRLATAVCLAVGRLFRDHADRWNRATSRLKFLVRRKGIAWCRAIVTADLATSGVDTALLETAPVVDLAPPPPARPLADPAPRGTDGLGIGQIMIPRGELSFHTFHRLAELSERFGDKRLRTTNRQNLEIHGVRPADQPALEREIEALGLRTEGFFGLQDVVTCVGTTYCPLAVTRTHDLVDALRPVVDDERYAAIRSRVLVNVTGCPNACSPDRIADLGFRGARLRSALGSVEGYEMCVGGTQERHGQRIGDFRLEDGPRVAAAILDTFLARGDGAESLADHVAREGIAAYRAAIDALGIAYEVAPALAAMSVTEGQAATPLDGRTYARDVPCQAACPARTRVPQYIARIAAGDPDGAYRINQEDNVFPGVLGRVCSRPCEPACRHTWTGTEGAVRICHLKRFAADGKSFTPRPLAPWFPPTGKRVAVVGSGPSGLAAARELARYGHAVTIYEAEQVLGGMMRLAIPVFRLPREVVEAEIDAVMRSGVEARRGERVDGARMTELLADFDALVVAAGAIEPRHLDLPGLEGADQASTGGYVAGVRLMKDFNLDRAAPPRPPVLVVGGGYTAVDCVRASRRLLGPDGGEVRLLYRRTEAEMSASMHELEEIRREGIAVETLVAPVAVRTENGRVAAVTFRRMALGEADKARGDKPPVTPLAGTDYEEACGTLVAAIGQTRVIETLPEGTRVEGKRTSVPGLFVAGDLRYGSLDVIHAVADGKAVADEIDAYLMRKRRREAAIAVETLASGWTGRVRDMDLVTPPAMPTLGLGDRTAHGEVELGFGDDEAHRNALRCYLCNYRYEIDQDRCIHCDWCIKVMPRDCIRKVRRIFHDGDGVVDDFVETELPRDATYIWIDAENCIRCGACLRICPTDAIACRRADSVCAPCDDA